jgi:hypothetical protein
VGFFMARGRADAVELHTLCIAAAWQPEALRASRLRRRGRVDTPLPHASGWAARCAAGHVAEGRRLAEDPYRARRGWR